MKLEQAVYLCKQRTFFEPNEIIQHSPNNNNNTPVFLERVKTKIRSEV